MTDLAAWSYRCCEPMSRLWPADPERVWEGVLEALGAGPGSSPGPASGAAPGR